MKNIIEHINKAFENKIRLGVMSILTVHDNANFNSLKEWLSVTDGNLSSHLKGLEEQGYIRVQKQFIERKPNTSYAITEKGHAAFVAHLNALEDLLKTVS
ncbi:MAG: transcriptional regulator [Bacteroidales bacterium]|jgi:DNA-binding HxlR family transcriptional regulator|nr:transcriptional regulator [Bacteroidales bacterium]